MEKLFRESSIKKWSRNSEFKNTVTEIKNWIKRVSGKLDTEEKRLSKLEDRSVENIQTEA